MFIRENVNKVRNPRRRYIKEVLEKDKMDEIR